MLKSWNAWKRLQDPKKGKNKVYFLSSFYVAIFFVFCWLFDAQIKIKTSNISKATMENTFVHVTFLFLIVSIYLRPITTNSVTGFVNNLPWPFLQIWSAPNQTTEILVITAFEKHDWSPWKIKKQKKWWICKAFFILNSINNNKPLSCICPYFTSRWRMRQVNTISN